MNVSNDGDVTSFASKSVVYKTNGTHHWEQVRELEVATAVTS
jgi:hypothetical protein